MLEHELATGDHLRPGPVSHDRGRGRGRGSRRRWLVGVVVAVVVATAHVTGGGGVVNTAGWPQLRRFLLAALSPELSPDFLGLVADASLTTLAYAVLGTAVSLAIGLAGGVLGSRAWSLGPRRAAKPGARRARARLARARLARARFAWVSSRLVLAVPRGIHEAVWALLLLAVLGLDPLVAVIAIGVPYGAVTAKVFAEILDDVAPGPYASLWSAGVGRTKALAYGLLPSAAVEMVSYGFYRFECSIRAAAILGIVGAGGLGFELALSFQSLRYEQMWTLIAALVVLSGATDAWGSRVRRALGGRSGSSDGRLRRDRFAIASVVAVAGLVLVSIRHLELGVSSLWSERTRDLAGDLTSRALPPRLPPGGAAELFGLAVETLAMSVVAMALAGGAASVVAFAVARRGGSGPWSRLAARAGRGVLLVCRAVPPPVGALVVLFVMFPGPLPGAVALGVYNFGILGRLMAESVENLPPGPVSALRSQGAARAATFLYAEVPQALPRFAAYTVYRWEVTIRETVVVGLVGAGGLGRAITEQLAAFDYAALTTTLGVLVVLTVAVDFVGSGLRRALG